MPRSKRNRSPRRGRIRKILVASGLSVLVLSNAIWLFLSFDVIPGHKALTAYLAKHLTEVYPGAENTRKGGISSDTVVYVLGGSQKDLIERFKSVAALC